MDGGLVANTTRGSFYVSDITVKSTSTVTLNTSFFLHHFDISGKIQPPTNLASIPSCFSFVNFNSWAIDTGASDQYSFIS